MADDTSKLVPKALGIIEATTQLAALAYSDDGKLLVAAGRDGLVHRWDLSAVEFEPKPNPDPKAKPAPKNAPPPKFTPPALPTLAGHHGWVTGLRVVKDRIVSIDSWGALSAWKISGGDKPLWSVPQAHDGWVRQLAVSADGQQLATCGRDELVRLWSLADGKPLGELSGQNEDVYSVALHPDGKSLVSGDLKGTLQHWDLATRKSVRKVELPVYFFTERLQDVGGIRTITFNKDGTQLYCGGSKPKSGGFVQGSPEWTSVDWSSGKVGQSINLASIGGVFVHELHWHPDGYLIGIVSGQPGDGNFSLHKPGDAAPFFSQKLANCHAAALDLERKRLVVASNAGPFGQAASMAREGKYFPNTSPLNFWSLAPAAG